MAKDEKLVKKPANVEPVVEVPPVNPPEDAPLPKKPWMK